MQIFNLKIQNYLIFLLYIYYFIKFGELQNNGLIPEGIMPRLAFTVFSPLADAYFWLANVANFIIQSKSFSDHLKYFADICNLGNQWSSTGFKYYIIASGIFLIIEKLTVGNDKNTRKK